MSNFRIFIHRNEDVLHIKLMGDFDELSAFNLIDALENVCAGIRRVMIHTDCLKTISSTGLSAFKQRFSQLTVPAFMISFTGKHSSRIMPIGALTV